MTGKAGNGVVVDIEGGTSSGLVRFVQIEPTTHCNFTCGFCSGRHMDQSNLSFDTFETLLNALPGLEHIELQGEGEPLLHRRFFDMVTAAQSRDIRVSLITNGSLLTTARIDKILDLGISAIMVSIESSDPLEFRRIRGGRLENVVNGISRLLAIRNERGLTKPSVGFAVTVLKQTVDALPEIANLYDRLGMDGGLSAQTLSGMDADTQGYDEIMAGQLIDRDASARVQGYVASFPRIRQLMRQYNDGRHFYIALEKTHPTGDSCPWVRGALYIDRHGCVMPCRMIKDAEKYGLGKVGETPVTEMLKARQVLERRLAADEIPNQCQGCQYVAQMKSLRRKTTRTVESQTTQTKATAAG